MTVSLSSPQTDALPQASPDLSDGLFNPDVIQAEQVLACDWRDLTLLGVSPAAARQIARTLIVKRLIGIYGRRLIQAQVPTEAARRIARTVAKYDVLEILPTLSQQTLLRQHCPAICRAGLWRVEMLLRARE